MAGRALITKEEIYEANSRFLAVRVETVNAVMVLLSEGEDRLGTLAASVPPTAEMRTQPLVSSILLGDRNTATARMFAERLALGTGKIGLVSIYLKSTDEVKGTQILVKLFKKITSVNEGAGG